jgi:hypothetical protein
MKALSLKTTILAVVVAVLTLAVAVQLLTQNSSAPAPSSTNPIPSIKTYPPLPGYQVVKSYTLNATPISHTNTSILFLEHYANGTVSKENVSASTFYYFGGINLANAKWLFLEVMNKSGHLVTLWVISFPDSSSAQLAYTAFLSATHDAGTTMNGIYYASANNVTAAAQLKGNVLVALVGINATVPYDQVAQLFAQIS